MFAGLLGLKELTDKQILPVNHIVRVKICQPLQCTVGNSSYFYFLERLFVNCKEKEEFIHQKNQKHKNDE